MACPRAPRLTVSGRMWAVSDQVDPTGRKQLRFLTLDQVAEELSTSRAQVTALVRSGELPGIKVGGRGQWRVEVSKLEAWIAERYQQTADYVAANPFPGDASTAAWEDS